jgi:hypothetical protein
MVSTVYATQVTKQANTNGTPATNHHDSGVYPSHVVKEVSTSEIKKLQTNTVINWMIIGLIFLEFTLFSLTQRKMTCKL